jgi:predicted ATPase
LAGARTHLELALNSYVRTRDSEIRERFGFDTGVVSRVFLAQTSWLSGDLHRARQLIDEAMRLASELGHTPSIVNALFGKLGIEGLRNEPQSIVAEAEKLLRISQQHRMEYFVTAAQTFLSWARGRLGDARSGSDELRKSLDDYAAQGNALGRPRFLGRLAELEAAAEDAERALARKVWRLRNREGSTSRTLSCIACAATSS